MIEQKAFQERKNVGKLLLSAQNDDVDFFKGICLQFDEGEVVHVRDARNRSCLHHAAQHGNLPICQYLVEKLQADINCLDETGLTPLCLACSIGQEKCSEMLINYGAKVKGTLALHHAASAGSLKIINSLLQKGADVNEESESGTPLVWAATYGLWEVVQLLLDKDADVNAVAKDSSLTVLHVAVAEGSVGMVKTLLQKGANCNAVVDGGHTPLHMAAGNSDAAIASQLVQIIRQFGGNLDAVDEDGCKPIHSAAYAGHVFLVQELLPVTQHKQDEEWTVDSIMKFAQKFNNQQENEQQDSTENNTVKNIEVEEAEDPDEEKAQQLKQLGDECFKGQNYNRAFQYYTQSLRHGTKNHLVWGNRSASSLKIGDHSTALIDAQKCRSLNPQYVKGWYREGCAAMEAKLWETAAQAFFEGVRLDPDNEVLAQSFSFAVEQGRLHNQTSNKQQKTT